VPRDNLAGLIEPMLDSGIVPVCHYELRIPKFIVHGYPHQYEIVPLQSNQQGNEIINQNYINSGTWHSVHELARSRPGQKRCRHHVMTYLAFFKGDEGREERSRAGPAPWIHPIKDADAKPKSRSYGNPGTSVCFPAVHRGTQTLSFIFIMLLFGGPGDGEILPDPAPRQCLGSSMGLLIRSYYAICPHVTDHTGIYVKIFQIR
jgi:hypothetical protein